MFNIILYFHVGQYWARHFHGITRVSEGIPFLVPSRASSTALEGCNYGGHPNMDATDKPNGSPRAAGRTSRTSSRASNCSKRGVSQGGPSRHRPEYQVNSGNLGWCLAGFDVFFFWGAPHQTWPQRSIKLGGSCRHPKSALVQRMTIGMMMMMLLLMMISLDSLGMGLPGRDNSSGEENEAIECQVCCRGARCDARWHRWRHEPSEGFESEGNRWEASDFLF